MIKKICHLTSAHAFNDIRIFHKECKTLQKSGCEVFLIAQHGRDEVVDGISILAIPTPLNRKERMTRITKTLYNRALEIDADIYHFHDPELTRVGLRLKRRGKKVIYDVHEDLPRQIMTKEWIPGPTRAVISWIVELIENFAARRYDAVVCATPCIYERFIYLNNSVININNYPIANELFIPQGEWSIKEMAVCYVGGIHSLRGIYEMINAIGQTKAKLLLAGNFDSDVERDLSIKIPGWSNVIELGQISRQQVKNVLSRSIAGLVLFHPAPNHINAQPNKMFEYMSAGIPVIASDFPLWKEIIEKNQCGICVNPLDCEAIADAINWIIANPKEAERMGKNGRGAIEQIYNWESESIKLRQLYGSLTT